MSIKRIYAVYLRQIFLIQSNPTRLASIFLWLVIDVIQWGFISKYLSSLGTVTFGYITVILGAVILWEFSIRIQHGVMMGFLEDIWSQNFINYFASPLKVREYLGGLVLISFSTSVAGFVVMLVIAGFAFDYYLFKIGLFLFPLMLILLIFGMAMGIFSSAIIFRLGPSAEWLGWPIPIVLSIFTGVYYPLATLPHGLQIFAKFIPPSYVFESLRTFLLTDHFSRSLAIHLTIGILLSLFYFVLVYKFFIDVYEKNLKNGAIARFNAEAL